MQWYHRPATTTTRTVYTWTVMPANKGSVSANGSLSTHMAPDSTRRTPSTRLLHRNLPATGGLYQHISLPRAIPALKPAAVQQWLREGDLERLRQLVTDGQGHRLLGEKPALQSTRLFLRTLPGLMARQEELHSAAEAGRTDQVASMLQSDETEGARLVVSKDTAGLGLLHKAVLGGHIALANMLLERYPQTLALRDNEGRTALHYCGASPDPATMWSLLETAGVDSEVVDRRGNRARHYMPKSGNLNKTRLGVTQVGTQAATELPVVVTRAHIRKWIHERDLGKLEKLVWEGHGERLLPETSASPRVRRFLEAVPFIMSIIKEVHTAAVNNNLSLWQMRTSPPVPSHLIISQDKNGLTPLHKAAGLCHVEILDEILRRSPKAATITDIEQRSPLHYAAVARHSSSSDVYRKLVEAGADEKQTDKKGKSALYYAEHPAELETTSFLSTTPEAPRAPTNLPLQWNWGMLSLGVDTMLNKTMTVLSSIKPTKNLNKQNPRTSHSHPNLAKIQQSNAPFISTSNSHPDLTHTDTKATYLKNKKINNTNSNKSQLKIINKTNTYAHDKHTKRYKKLPNIHSSSNPPDNNPTTSHPHPKTKSIPQKSMNVQDSNDKTHENSQLNDVSSKTNHKPATTSQVTSDVSNTKTSDTPESKETNTLPFLPPMPVNKQLSQTFPVGKMQIKAGDANATKPLDPKLLPRAAGLAMTHSSFDTPATTFSFSPGALYQPPQTAPSRSEVSHISSVPPGTAPSMLRGKPSEALRELPSVRPISPPGSRMPAPVLERWVRAGDMGRLEDALLEGRGARLLKLIASTARESPIRNFVDRAPIFLEGMQRMHNATIEGNEAEVRFLLSKYRRLVLARDEEGMQPMHLAARAGHENILRLFLSVFPRGVGITDWEGRTPLHYAGMCVDMDRALPCYQLLLARGASETTKDAIGNKASDYLSEPRMHQPAVLPRQDTPVVPSQPQTPATPEMRKETVAQSIETPVTANMASNTVPPGVDIAHLPTALLAQESSSPEQNNQSPPDQINGVSPGQMIGLTPEYVDDDKHIQISEPDNTPEQSNNHSEITHTEENIVVPNKLPDPPADVASNAANIVIKQSSPAEPIVNNINYSDPIREEARRLVEARDTEKLAELVLNGHGEKLKGLTSSNPYVQGLLDNVPIYMDKIAVVHEAAARGDVAALQVALERRKFVTSRDKYGATPLHKAVLFLQVGVARYLGARFPETLNAQDHAGRSPLHYAAVLPDRGAIYKSLVALGADPSLRDKLCHENTLLLQRCHTALDYQLHHEQRRNHEQLLDELGADPSLAGSALDPARAAAAAAAAAVSLDMLQTLPPEPPKSRADATRTSKTAQRRTQDGQYVANSVGEPLLKGLMEVSSVRPKDPIAFLANYLYNFPYISKREPESVPSRVQTGYRDEEVRRVDNNKERLKTSGSMSSTAGSINRDEHGQSMLHLAAARSHSRNAFAQLLREAGLSVGQRDAIYRTPRDVAIEANLPENVRDIDAWVIHLALEGDTTRLEELLLDGYDHILDVKDASGVGILELVHNSSQQDSSAFLKSVQAFENKRDWIHRAIRSGSLEGVREMMTSARLAVARNSRGRCSLHVAVLCQQESIVEFIATTFPITLSAGDNLERTALHYAMAMDKAEVLSMILVKDGARRTLKDLRGRQASFYFVNRGDILRLREEELRESKTSTP